MPAREAGAIQEGAAAVVDEPFPRVASSGKGNHKPTKSNSKTSIKDLPGIAHYVAQWEECISAFSPLCFSRSV